MVIAVQRLYMDSICLLDLIIPNQGPSDPDGLSLFGPGPDAVLRTHLDRQSMLNNDPKLLKTTPKVVVLHTSGSRQDLYKTEVLA